MSADLVALEVGLDQIIQGQEGLERFFEVKLRRASRIKNDLKEEFDSWLHAEEAEVAHQEDLGEFERVVINLQERVAALRITVADHASDRVNGTLRHRQEQAEEYVDEMNSWRINIFDNHFEGRRRLGNLKDKARDIEASLIDLESRFQRLRIN
ncbi:hypothetical protein QAD02_007423 [Eretmocerus hayati]|uniref:Uncharacterized protein n=1 Tax=Eretmocerus hayati TaxID=131215 RepID=A0ACC2N4E4_9HYME|nr:hypothetical protein QAD02_007423 [Eretmocerus hayati]